MQSLEEYTISPAKQNQAIFFQQIQKQLCWDPLINSYLVLYQISPGGLLLGKIGGKIISCILALKYSKKFGFIAVYWVRKQFRGKGYGVKIFQRALEFLSDCETLALDSVPDQIPNYSKWGFVQYCNAMKCYARDYKSQTNNRHTKIFKNYKHVDINKILEFDSVAFPGGENRKKQLITSFQNGQVFISVKDNKVQGYGVIFKCCSGLALSPMYCLNQQAAEDIVNEIFEHYRYSKQIIMAFVFDQYNKIDKFMKSRFPIQGYNCRRMYLRMPQYEKDFSRSCVYSFNSYERG